MGPHVMVFVLLRLKGVKIEKSFVFDFNDFGVNRILHCPLQLLQWHYQFKLDVPEIVRQTDRHYMFNIVGWETIMIFKKSFKNFSKKIRRTLKIFMTFALILSKFRFFEVRNLEFEIFGSKFETSKSRFIHIT